ncbi:50S ribosomal protein L10 [archaeon]|jgi:large subunit ribosomal protein L10|nr:50S ribosomal protein L10 [archaeon]
MKAHVSDAKKAKLKELKALMDKASVVGIIDLTNLPSPQFQKIKHKLRDKLQIVVAKKSLIKLALKDTEAKKKGLMEFNAKLEHCMPALLFSEEDVFKISKNLDKNKSKAPAKAGQISPRSITIPAGPTAFAAGPIIGELGKAGIKATIENGKVAIQEDKILLNAGDEITQENADLLAKFKIEPIEIGLNLVGLYKDGQIFNQEVLFIDDEEYKSNIQQAAQEAINLAVFSVYPSKDVIELLLQKAERDSLALESSQKLLEKLESNEEPKETPKEETTEEKPVAEKTEETSQSETSNDSEKITEEQPAEEQPAEEETSPDTKSESNESEKTNLDGYSKEEEQKAQDMINQIKDKDISGGK